FPYTTHFRSSSSAGQSSGLIIRRSWVQAPPGAPFRHELQPAVQPWRLSTPPGRGQRARDAPPDGGTLRVHLAVCLRPPAQGTMPVMRLATFNILHGRSVTDDEVDLDRYARAVASLDADILALQEVDRDQPRSHGADLTAIAAEAMGAVAHRFAATLTGLPTVWTAATGDLQPGTASYGVALLSRWPVSSWQVIPIAPMPRAAPVMRLDDDALTMVVDEPRVALAAVVETPDGPLTAVSTHLSFIPEWTPIQLDRLVTALADLPRPAVLLGDLNMFGSRPTALTGWR